MWLLPGGEHAWDTTRYGDMINERAVRILLECILVMRENLICCCMCLSVGTSANCASILVTNNIA